MTGNAITYAGCYIALTVLLRLWGIPDVEAFVTGIAFTMIMGLAKITSLLEKEDDD